MQYQLEELGATKRKLAVEVPAETVQAEMDKTLKDMRKQAKIRGFRPGKAPVSIIRKMFGAMIQQDVSQKLIEEALPKALDPYKDEMVTAPTLADSKFTDGEPFTFEVLFEVRPAFTLEGYQGLELERETAKVTDEAVEQRIEGLRQAYATTKSLEDQRPVFKGDLAVVDYKAFEGDQPVEGGANPNYQLEVGAGRFNETFEEGLVGLSKGDEKEIMVTFPADHYNPKLAGKDIRFQVKLVDIRVKVLPELTDDFAKQLDQELETLDQLRAHVRDDLEKAEVARAQNQVERAAKDKLLALAQFEAPEELVANELEALLNATRFNLRRSGLTPEAVGLSEAKMREDYQPEAEKRVKVALILDKIAKAENLTVDDAEVDDKIMEMAREMGQTPAAVRDFYNNDNRMEGLREGLSSEKTLRFVLDHATIKDVEPTPQVQD